MRRLDADEIYLSALQGIDKVGMSETVIGSTPTPTPWSPPLATGWLAHHWRIDARASRTSC